MSENFFPDTEQILAASIEASMVAVIGVDSVTRNTAAALLHELGVKMGEKKVQWSPSQTVGAYVAPGLTSTCGHLYSEPWWIEQTNFSHRRALLQMWASKRIEASGASRPLIGGTHPTFCLMAQELSEAWNRPTVVIVHPRDNSQPIQCSEGWRQMQSARMEAGLQSFAPSLFSQILELDFRKVEDEHAIVSELAEKFGLDISGEAVLRIAAMLRQWVADF